jgi:hypothetical protein
MDRNAEIAQINHELDILRERRATHERSERRLRLFFLWLLIVFLPILGTIFYQDPLAGLFIGGLAVVMCMAALLWYSLDPNSRWILTVTSSGISPRMRVYDARVIDEQITEREQRLAELG